MAQHRHFYTQQGLQRRSRWHWRSRSAAGGCSRRPQQSAEEQAEGEKEAMAPRNPWAAPPEDGAVTSVALDIPVGVGGGLGERLASA